MAANKGDLERWFDAGVEQGAHHMIVVVDGFDHEDYPSYVSGDENAADVAKEKYGYPGEKNMQRVMEVYDLRLSKEDQMAERRAFHF